jgi:hypothetical protein
MVEATQVAVENRPTRSGIDQKRPDQIAIRPAGDGVEFRHGECRKVGNSPLASCLDAT